MDALRTRLLSLETTYKRSAEHPSYLTWQSRDASIRLRVDLREKFGLVDVITHVSIYSRSVPHNNLCDYIQSVLLQ